MRLDLTSDAGGDFRLRLLPDKPRPSRKEEDQGSALVCSSKLQERIYRTANTDQAGHGFLKSGSRFTRLAKKRLNEYGGIIDQGDLKCCLFLTGTLPGGSVDAIKALAMWSSWLTSRLAQWLRDRFPGALYFGVWEYQKRGALHLHVCVRVKTISEAWLLRKLWKTRWISLLDSIARRSGVDVFERQGGGTWAGQRWIVKTDCQTVEKSVARYLSKYCSKSKDKLRRKAAYPPASWWFASANLRATAKSLRIEISVSSLSLSDGNSLFDKIGAFMVSLGTSAYPMFNRFDYRQRGLICLGPASVAGACVRALRPLLELVDPHLKPLSDGNRCTVGRVALMFAGAVL